MLEKLIAFEYILNQLLEKGVEGNSKFFQSSFTRLKALKLLFLVAAVKNQYGNDLLDVFDNFYALPNGPVESDVYNSITADTLQYYSFKNFSASEKQVYSTNGLNDDLKERLDESISSLLKVNDKILSYSAEQLVTLSHMWSAWGNAIALAKAFDKGSYPMSINSIRNCNQIFSL